MSKKLNITLIRSPIGCKKSHKACLIGLGVRRMHKQVQVDNTPCNLGMINKVAYLLNVSEVA